jgi:hypothetical protein
MTEELKETEDECCNCGKSDMTDCDYDHCEICGDVICYECSIEDEKGYSNCQECGE